VAIPIMKAAGVRATPPTGALQSIKRRDDVFGWVARGLEALYLFEEGSGTVLGPTIGVGNGAIDSIAASNNAYSWLAGGGLQLSGAQLASLPAFEANSAWTIFSALRVVGHTGSAGVEKVVGLLGLRNFGLAPPATRGGVLYQRGATNLSATHANAYYAGRTADGAGGQGTENFLSPASFDTYNKPRLAAVSYDGSANLYCRVYEPDGSLFASATIATSDATLFTVSGVPISSMQWALGGLNALYAGGVVQHECAALHSVALVDFSAAEIAAIAEAAGAIGADRGRAW
jgi:hypothetical protein